MVVSNVVRERNVGVCGGWGWGSKAREVILGRCTRVTVGTNGFHGPVVLLRSALSLHTTHSATRRSSQHQSARAHNDVSRVAPTPPRREQKFYLRGRQAIGENRLCAPTISRPRNTSGPRQPCPPASVSSSAARSPPTGRSVPSHLRRCRVSGDMSWVWRTST